MSKQNTAGTEPRRAVVRLFEARRTRIADLPVLRAVIADFSPQAGAVIAEITGMSVTASLASMSQEAGKELAATPAEVVAVLGWIPEWSEPAICWLDRLLLFRALDAMYGGEHRARTEAPQRALTPLERSLAALLGGALLRRLAAALGDICVFSVQSERHAEEHDLSVMSRKKSEYLMLGLRIVEHDDSVALGIPLSGLEHARDRLTTAGEEVATSHDPSWTRAFRHTVDATPIHIVASADGPDMLLSDVAKLQPGSMLEFPGSRLRQITVEGGQKAVFTGRLGQSKGMYTICIGQPRGPSTSGDEGEQP